MSETEPRIAVARPKLRWYQFSLRTLLIVVWTLGPVLGWIGRPICHRIAHEYELRAAIAKLKKELEACATDEDYNTPESLSRWIKRAFPKRAANTGQPQSPPTAKKKR